MNRKEELLFKLKLYEREYELREWNTYYTLKEGVEEFKELFMIGSFIIEILEELIDDFNFNEDDYVKVCGTL